MLGVCRATCTRHSCIEDERARLLHVYDSVERGLHSETRTEGEEYTTDKKEKQYDTNREHTDWSSQLLTNDFYPSHSSDQLRDFCASELEARHHSRRRGSWWNALYQNR